MKRAGFLFSCVLLMGAAALQAQEPVTAAADTDALFRSPDPVLNKNKQAAYGIVKVLLEAGHWDRAGEFLTERYIQHNPLAKSGRADLKKPKYLSGDFSPQFSIKHMHKDLRLALAHAASLGLRLDETTAVERAYATAEERGLGELDFAALLQVVRASS